jgi:hypothetical protein
MNSTIFWNNERLSACAALGLWLPDDGLVDEELGSDTVVALTD